ncbi:MAG: peptidylprolyl isomerase [Deltaproteobacteria bacterium]|nr:peptidylprolyl isomerase [Deltaproteobacteria bacterium]
MSWLIVLCLAATPETPEQLYVRLGGKLATDAVLTPDVIAAGVQDPKLRYAAVAAAARVKKADGFAAAVAPAVSDSDPETRAMATKAMAKQGAAPESFIALLADTDWRVRVEAMRGALPAPAKADRAAVTKKSVAKPEPNKTAAFAATVLTRAWLESSTAPGAMHPVFVGLEAALPYAKEPAIKAMYETVYVQSLVSIDVDRKRAGCLAAYGRLLGGGGTLAQVASCADADSGALIAARAIEEGQGASERAGVLLALWKHPAERVRAAAAAAAVFAKVQPQIVDQALGAKETSLVAFAADAMARAAAEKKMPAPAWLAKAAKRLTDPALEVDAKLSLLEAVSAAVYKPALPACQALVADLTLRTQAEGCVAALSGGKPASAPVSGAGASSLPFDPASLRGKKIDLKVVTNKGAFTIRLDGRVAPHAASSFAHLAATKFFDGTIFHRVVANFVIQGGDPSGTGTTGAGYALPAEPSLQAFSRGAVGIADSGPDTGGSQWFVMHSRSPHLEARYTWVGTVVDGMDVVDRIQVGDRIETVR